MLRRWLIFGLALMLLSLSLGAWGVSHWRWIIISHKGKTFLPFILNSGRVLIGWESMPGTTPKWYFSNTGAAIWAGLDQRSRFYWLGFSYGVDFGRSYLTIPLWFPSFLFLLLLWFA